MQEHNPNPLANVTIVENAALDLRKNAKEGQQLNDRSAWGVYFGVGTQLGIVPPTAVSVLVIVTDTA